MKLLPKFALLSIGVAAVPLAIAGYSSIRVSRTALGEAIKDHEVLLARQISEYVSSHLANLQSTMSVEPRILDLTRVGGALPTFEALRKFLQLVYHQSDDFSVVALLGTEGQPLVPAAFQSVAPRNDSFGTHEIISAEDVAARTGTSKRTAYRDILALGTELGLPIWSDDGRHGRDRGTTLSGCRASRKTPLILSTGADR